MRAKLVGLPRSRRHRRAPLSAERHSLPARYARAIATYRHADVRSALEQIDALIQAQPGNPLFPRAQGPGAAGKRARRPKPSRRCGAPSSSRRTRR